MREQGAAGVSPVSVHESVTSEDEHYIAAAVTGNDSGRNGQIFDLTGWGQSAAGEFSRSRIMYEIKTNLFGFIKKPKISVMCNYLRALVVKISGFIGWLMKFWESFAADEKYYLELNCSRFEFLTELIDKDSFKTDTLKYLKRM